ncbi:MAG: hypothetical protein ABIJ21_08760 [Nanoarchaeota archaeon]
MKTKKFVIEIKPLEESLRDFAQAFGKTRKDRLPESSGVSFSDIETFRKFFSRRRLELLKAIRKENPKSIYQLAKQVDRGYKNVHDDINLFKELGLIKTTDKHINLQFDTLFIKVEV